MKVQLAICLLVYPDNDSVVGWVKSPPRTVALLAAKRSILGRHYDTQYFGTPLLARKLVEGSISTVDTATGTHHSSSTTIRFSSFLNISLMLQVVGFSLISSSSSTIFIQILWQPPWQSPWLRHVPIYISHPSSRYVLVRPFVGWVHRDIPHVP